MGRKADQAEGGGQQVAEIGHAAQPQPHRIRLDRAANGFRFGGVAEGDDVGEGGGGNGRRIRPFRQCQNRLVAVHRPVGVLIRPRQQQVPVGDDETAGLILVEGGEIGHLADQLDARRIGINRDVQNITDLRFRRLQEGGAGQCGQQHLLITLRGQVQSDQLQRPKVEVDPLRGRAGVDGLCGIKDFVR
jgi:hypothetical protein